MIDPVQSLREGAVADPAQPLSRLPLLSEHERQQLRRFNDTAVPYPQPHLLHRLITRQVESSPDAVALRCGSTKLSYAELHRRACLLAHTLRRHGVAADVPVGVCMERSAELVVALLGSLYVGGAYTPLDPDYPLERLAVLLADANPPVLLCQRHLLDRLPVHRARVILLDEGWGADTQSNLGLPPTELPLTELTEDSLAYIIYTSGSTGRPKGVMTTHRGICNRLLWMQQHFQLTAGDVVVQKSPFSFDVSVWEFFWPLLAGAKLVLARPGGHKDPAYLAELIAREQVTVCHFVPSMLEAFLHEPGLEQSCAGLRDVICSGEALSRDLTERFFARLPCPLHNLYGPTEAAVDVTFWQCRSGDKHARVPIGAPIANTQMHVLDRHLREVPIGVPGELFIGGINLARGYLGQPQLTAERFVDGGPERGRLYRTGDLGRWLGEGVLEYLGRLDHQVKIRGVRVEL
ncbi:MAG TPA: amino acid adenylation domain-containing protein, partial [Steroidobacteraceae bacterium]